MDPSVAAFREGVLTISPEAAAAVFLIRSHGAGARTRTEPRTPLPCSPVISTTNKKGGRPPNREPRGAVSGLQPPSPAGPELRVPRHAVPTRCVAGPQDPHGLPSALSLCEHVFLFLSCSLSSYGNNSRVPRVTVTQYQCGVCSIQGAHMGSGQGRGRGVFKDLVSREPPTPAQRPHGRCSPVYLRRRGKKELPCQPLLTLAPQPSVSPLALWFPLLAPWDPAQTSADPSAGQMDPPLWGRLCLHVTCRRRCWCL